MKAVKLSAAVCGLKKTGRTSRRNFHGASALIAAVGCIGMCSSALAQSASWSGRATCGYLQQCDPMSEADGRSFASPVSATGASVGWVGLVPRAFGLSSVDITHPNGNYDLYVRGYADVQSTSCPGGIASAEGKCDVELTLTRVQKVQISYQVSRNGGHGISSASMSGPAGAFSVSVVTSNAFSASNYAILPAGTYSISGTVQIDNSPSLMGAYFSVRITVFSCAGDFNGDGVIDFFDYLDFLEAYAAGDPSADINGDGVVDFFDYLDFVALYDAGC